MPFVGIFSEVIILSHNPEEEGKLPNMALGLLNDPAFAKSMQDLAQPMMKTQEAVMQKIIDSQNQLNQLVVQLIEVSQTNQTKLDELLKKGN